MVGHRFRRRFPSENSNAEYAWFEINGAYVVPPEHVHLECKNVFSWYFCVFFGLHKRTAYKWDSIGGKENDGWEYVEVPFETGSNFRARL